MTIVENLATIRARIDEACVMAGRDPHEVRLLPVSKYHSISEIRIAAEAGFSCFGENKMQELEEKAVELGPEGVSFAAIGHVQTNKARVVAEHAAELQSLDSLKLASALQRRLIGLGRTLPVLIQVNTSGEASKSGIAAHSVVDFAKELRQFDALEPRGLMTMAAHTTDEAAIASCFRSLAALRTDLRNHVGGQWDELSMGMSGDFRIAIAEGSTCVRIGSAIFGPRPQKSA